MEEPLARLLTVSPLDRYNAGSGDEATSTPITYLPLLQSGLTDIDSSLHVVMPSELSTWKLTEPSMRTANLTRARDVTRILPLPIGNPDGAADAHLARLTLIADLCSKPTADSRRSLETLCNSETETTSDDRRTYLSLVRMTSELLPKLTDGDPIPAVDFTLAPTTDEQCKDYLSVMSLAAMTENSSYRFALSPDQEMDLLAAVIQGKLRFDAIPPKQLTLDYCTKVRNSARQRE
jgi:hypothetical protein